jgi:hypothetical protein
MRSWRLPASAKRKQFEIRPVFGKLFKIAKSVFAEVSAMILGKFLPA